MSIVEDVPKQLFIGGEWRDAGEGGTLEVEDPSTGEALASVADATVDDAKAALTAAHEGRAERGLRVLDGRVGDRRQRLAGRRVLDLQGAPARGVTPLPGDVELLLDAVDDLALVGHVVTVSVPSSSEIATSIE